MSQLLNFSYCVDEDVKHCSVSTLLILFIFYYHSECDCRLVKHFYSKLVNIIRVVQKAFDCVECEGRHVTSWKHCRHIWT